jgi:hypothetical protein
MRLLRTNHTMSVLVLQYFSRFADPQLLYLLLDRLYCLRAINTSIQSCNGVLRGENALHWLPGTNLAIHTKGRT